MALRHQQCTASTGCRRLLTSLSSSSSSLSSLAWRQQQQRQRQWIRLVPPPPQQQHRPSSSSTNGRPPLPPTPRVFPKSHDTKKLAAPSAAAADPASQSLYARTRNRGPVSWPSLFLVTVAAASAVAYYKIEREKRLERALGQIVSSESDGWTPRPDYLAKRKFIATPSGWFPVEDGFGAREFVLAFRWID